MEFAGTLIDVTYKGILVSGTSEKKFVPLRLPRSLYPR